MTPDATTTSTPAPQAAAPGSQPAPASPAAQPTPVQIFWDVAWLAFGLLARLSNVLHPVKARFPKQAWQIFYLCTDIPRILLTIRFAPERITMAQLRHLTRARHLLQALFNYTLPTLGPRTSSSASAPLGQSPSASPENATPLGPRTSSSATTPSPAVAAIRQVSGVPEVSGVPQVAATPASPSALQTRQAQNQPPQSALGNPQSAFSDSYSSPASHPSHDSHSSPTSYPSHSPQSSTPHSAFRIQHSAFSPYIPDYQTLLQALKAPSLPPNCAGTLFEEPGDALVKALHQLHAIYFSLYPHQSSPPMPSQSPSQSQSQFSGNLQSSIYNPQSGTPHSDAPSVHPVHSVHNVHSVHSPSPAQSEIPSPHSNIPHSEFRITHSSSPP